MTDPPFTFNLWTEPWIRATKPDGTPTKLGVGAALAEAHTLAALHDPSPLVVAGIHRLLTAILQAIYAPRDLDDIQAVLSGETFDLARLESFAAQYAARFDLFHPTAPFLQTGDVPLSQQDLPIDTKPISTLFSETPTATNRSHFHHVTDESHYVCPACCARGLVTIAPFASAAGRPYRPSINGVPPVYVLPAGTTLFESLALSLVTPSYQPPTADPQRVDTALWCGAGAIGKNDAVSAVGYIESLTFPARRMRLYPRQEHATCTQCGARTATVVGELLFEMGHWLSNASVGWEDPFVAFRKPKARSKNDETGLKPVRPEEGKALWREYNGLLLAEREEQFRPRALQQIADLVDRGALHEKQIFRFRCIGIRTDGKAKIFEWIDEELVAPPAILSEPLIEDAVDQALKQANDAERVLTSTFNHHFRPERDRSGYDDKLARFKTIRARMVASYWQRLAPQFRMFITTLAQDTDRDTTARNWAATLLLIGRQTFDEASAQVGNRADALRARVEGQAECYRRLHSKRKEWFDEQ
jgi:CRISPR system Cascade subunit CasA